MTTKRDFSEAEWALVAQAPFMAGLTISLLDMGVVSVVREMSAVIQAIASAKSDYPGNELIAEIVDGAKGSGSTGEPNSAKTPEAILADLGRVVALVDAKATGEEARGFKTFLLGVAEKSANASGSGLFGFGEKVSDKERAFLAQLRTTLGVG